LAASFAGADDISLFAGLIMTRAIFITEVLWDSRATGA